MTATLHLSRPFRIVDWAFPFTIVLDGRTVGQIRNRKSTEIHVEAGTHTLKLDYYVGAEESHRDLRCRRQRNRPFRLSRATRRDRSLLAHRIAAVPARRVDRARRRLTLPPACSGQRGPLPQSPSSERGRA